MAKQTKTQRFLAAREKGANSTIPFERRFWNLEDLRDFKSAAKHGLDKYYCLREQALKGRDDQWYRGDRYFKTIAQYDLYINLIMAACSEIGYRVEMYNESFFDLK